MAAFAVGYRFAVWAQRPPSRMYFRRGIELFFRRAGAAPLAEEKIARLQRCRCRTAPGRWATRLRGISWRRNSSGGAAGCAGSCTCASRAAARWRLRSRSRSCSAGFISSRFPDNAEMYRVAAFGLNVDSFSVHSVKAFVMFNLLNISAVLVLVGLVMAGWRRLHRSGRARDAELLRGHPAAAAHLRGHGDGTRAHGELQIPRRPRSRAVGDRPHGERRRAAALHPVWKTLPHVPADLLAVREPLQEGRRRRAACALPALRRGLREPDARGRSQDRARRTRLRLPLRRRRRAKCITRTSAPRAAAGCWRSTKAGPSAADPSLMAKLTLPEEKYIELYGPTPNRDAARRLERRRAGQTREDALLLLRRAVRHPAQGQIQQGHRLRAVGRISRSTRASSVPRA